VTEHTIISLCCNDIKMKPRGGNGARYTQWYAIVEDTSWEGTTNGDRGERGCAHNDEGSLWSIVQCQMTLCEMKGHPLS
jgi:hypothetical protein